MGLRTPLGQVRGLGSAKDGAAHWWAQRLTAVALVPLMLWLAASLVGVTGADHAAVSAWIGSPFVAIVLTLLVLAACHHAQLGVQVVIEDYVHREWMKLTLLIGVKFAAVVVAVAVVFAIIKLALGSSDA